MNHCDFSSHSLFRYSIHVILSVFSYCDYVQFSGNYSVIPSTACLNCFCGDKLCTFTSFLSIDVELGHFWIDMFDFFFLLLFFKMFDTALNFIFKSKKCQMCTAVTFE